MSRRRQRQVQYCNWLLLKSLLNSLALCQKNLKPVTGKWRTLSRVCFEARVTVWGRRTPKKSGELTLLRTRRVRGVKCQSPCKCCLPRTKNLYEHLKSWPKLGPLQHCRKVLSTLSDAPTSRVGSWQARCLGLQCSQHTPQFGGWLGLRP